MSLLQAPADRVPHPVAFHGDGNDRLLLLLQLLADREWPCPSPLRLRLSELASSLRASGAARIDERAWALLAEAIASYLDWRRLGRLLAQLQAGEALAGGFAAQDWDIACTHGAGARSAALADTSGQPARRILAR